jgi:2-C-methyl-D-erythritol 4-phosphate cytidylyltransferase
VRVAGILLAGGRGTRLGGETPKALVLFGGEPLLARALRTADGCGRLEGLVVVIPEGHEDEATAIAAASAKLLAVVAGGATRQGSVRRGLDALPNGFEAVVCHDVARPFAGPALYERVLDALEGADGAVPTVPVSDTVKRVRNGVVLETLPRDELVLVQTPQAFRRAALEEAHRRAERDGFTGTDDGALLERAGFRVAAVPGDPRNLKITDPVDLERATELLGRG